MPISMDDVRFYREKYMTWTWIEHKLNVSRKQLRLWRVNVRYRDDVIRGMSNIELDDIVSSYLSDHPRVGRRFVEGYL